MRPLGMTSTGFDIAAVAARSAAPSAIAGRTTPGRASRTWRTAPSARWAGCRPAPSDYASWVAFLLSAWPPRDGAEQGPVPPLDRARAGARARTSRRVGATGATGGAILPPGRDLRHGLSGRARIAIWPDAWPMAAAIPAMAPRCCCCPSAASASSPSPTAPMPARRRRSGPPRSRCSGRACCPRAACRSAPRWRANYAAAGAMWQAGSLAPGQGRLAMNFLMDRSAENWAAEFARLKAQTGDMPDRRRRSSPTGALTGTFSWTCERGRIEGQLCSRRPIRPPSRPCACASCRRSMTWAATILTLYPEMFPGPLGLSLAGRALAEGIWSLDTVQIRDFATDKHRSVDDTPAGGGAGMVMRADVLAAAVDHVLARRPDAPLLAMTPARRAADPGPGPRACRRARASRSCAAGSRGSTSACSRRGRSSRSRSATMCFRAASRRRWPCSMLAFGCFPG